MQWSLTVAVSTACFLCGVLSPVLADEARPRLNDSETIGEFNRLLDAGDLSKAEELAREAFLQSSSNPQAVLMVRQVFLMQKLQDASRNTASVTYPKTWNELSNARKLRDAVEDSPVYTRSKGSASDPFAPRGGQSGSGYGVAVITLRDGKPAAVGEGDYVPAPELSRTKHKSRPVTDSKKLREELESRVFAVADLVVPVPPFVVTGDADHKGAAAQPAPDSPQPEFSGLINLITHTIEPDSWSIQGGEGNIKAFSPSLGLVVRQTPTVQAKIEELLSNLRKEREVQVSLEVMRIEAPPEVLEKLCQSLRDIPATAAASACPECANHVGDAASIPADADSVGRGKLVFSMSLNSQGGSQSAGACCGTMNHVYQSQSHVLPAVISCAAWAVSPLSVPSVLTWISAADRKPVTVPKPMWISAPERERLLAKAQGQARTNVYCLPKVTLLNGQSGFVSTDSHSLQMLGVVSPNHKRVRLTCSLGTDSPDQPASPVTFALSDCEAILLPVKPEPGRRPQLMTMFLITPRILAPAVEAAECPPCEGIGATSLFPFKATAAEVSPPSLMESLYGGAIKHCPLPRGGSVTSRWNYTAPANDPPKYFQFGGVEIRR